jgi:hypothetical protein
LTSGRSGIRPSDLGDHGGRPGSGAADPANCYLSFATVVISADTSNADTVFVAGRILKHNGQLNRVDMPRLLERLSGARDHLLSNAGVIPKWISSRRD